MNHEAGSYIQDVKETLFKRNKCFSELDHQISAACRRQSPASPICRRRPSGGPEPEGWEPTGIAGTYASIMKCIRVSLTRTRPPPDWSPRDAKKTSSTFLFTAERMTRVTVRRRAACTSQVRSWGSRTYANTPSAEESVRPHLRDRC